VAREEGELSRAKETKMMRDISLDRDGRSEFIDKTCLDSITSSNSTAEILLAVAHH